MNFSLPRGITRTTGSRKSRSRLLRRAALATIGALALASSTPALARDLHARFGLGYNAQFANTSAANGVGALGLKYGLTRDIAVEAVIGVNTTSPTNGVTAAKLFKNIFFENNLNFYLMLGGGVVTAGTRTGAEFLGGFGSEFFIPGLESLGFSFELGASMDNLAGSFAVKTFGVSFLNAGMHFYF